MAEMLRVFSSAVLIYRVSQDQWVIFSFPLDTGFSGDQLLSCTGMFKPVGKALSVTLDGRVAKNAQKYNRFFH